MIEIERETRSVRDGERERWSEQKECRRDDWNGCCLNWEIKASELLKDKELSVGLKTILTFSCPIFSSSILKLLFFSQGDFIGYYRLIYRLIFNVTLQ